MAPATNELLSGLKESNEFGLIQSMAIRSMAKATYEVDNVGHYGLALIFTLISPLLFVDMLI